MSSLPSPSWRLPTSLLLLSLVPVAAGAVRLVGLAGMAGLSNGGGSGVAPENARFVAMPVPLVLHIVSATLFCLLGAFQFDAAFRRRSPGLHRVAGRVAAPCGILAALTGLWMTAAYAIPAELQGPLLYGVRMLVGVSMALAITVSVRAVVLRRIAQHRAWMVRAYALGQGAGTQVLIMLPVSLVAGAPTFLFRDVLMASAWGLNLLFAEWIIRRHLPSV
jgi:uncharacterized membrane protein YozB (DUF420 family)